ncbi:MAG: hypothetical protein IH944_12960 [Armatimonadetes bacterium]|nr:hypothetical protein [Armatimonadota bacterium]
MPNIEEFQINSFEEWVVHVFDHDDPDWHWETDAKWWDSDKHPEASVAYMTQLFEEPEALLERFTLDQIGAGINFVVSSGLSEFAFDICDQRVPQEDTIRCIHAMPTLYRKLFARHLPNEAGLGARGDDKCGYICFMFWDVFPMSWRTTNWLSRNPVGDSRDPQVQAENACVDAMIDTLQIDHLACQEAALHGLGHWHNHDPQRVKRAIDAYLRTIDRKHPLYDCAKRARRGSVQ